MKKLTHLSTIIFLCLIFTFTAHAKEKLLKDIESPADIKGWNKPQGQNMQISLQDPLLGTHSLKLYPYTYLSMSLDRTGVIGDWSGYDAIQIDFNNTTSKSQPLYVLIMDKDCIDAGSQYWDRHNGDHMLPPGKYTFTLPITGLYRGELGSRFNNLKHVVNTAEIRRFG